MQHCLLISAVGILSVINYSTCSTLNRIQEYLNVGPFSLFSPAEI